MTVISALALYFIIWWTVLFAVLPFSLRTQDDEGDTVLGTVASAPRGAHLRRAAFRTTLVSLVVFGAFYVVTQVLGFTANDLPKIVPEFTSK